MRFINNPLVWGISLYAFPSLDLSWSESEFLAFNLDEVGIATTSRVSLFSQSELKNHLKERIPGSKDAVLEKLANRMLALCKFWKFDPRFVLSVIEAESGFAPASVSPKGARGLMQVMPATAKFVASRTNIPYQHERQLFEPGMNISLGIAYLAYLRGMFGDDAILILAAYNAGPYSVQNAIRRNGRFKPVVTKAYIEKVVRRTIAYRRQGL